MRRILMVMLAFSALALTVSADSGDKIKDFTLTDVQGTEHTLSDYAGSKAIVLMFIATQCPVSNAYNERMVRLYEDYKDKDVVFLGVNSNKQESVEEIVGHSKEHGFAFPVLKDHKNMIADELKASVTPEIYVVNGELELLYHGRIDDSQREGKVTTQDLRTALDEILAGKSVTAPETKAFGCTIKRVN